MPVIIRTTATTGKTMTRSKRSSSPSPGEQTTTTTNNSLYQRDSPELGDQFVPNSSRVHNIKKTMILNNYNTSVIGQTSTTIKCPTTCPRACPTTSWSWRMVLLAFLASFFISTVPSTEASMDRWPYLGRYCVGRAGCETDFQDMIFNVSYYLFKIKKKRLQLFYIQTKNFFSIFVIYSKFTKSI